MQNVQVDRIIFGHIAIRLRKNEEVPNFIRGFFSRNQISDLIPVVPLTGLEPVRFRGEGF